MDPFLISPSERTRFEQQFNALNPINGIVTGDQAKGFLLQSQLPPAILGVIWALADTDADGKMNINEFSIACKLINLKLRGFELPKALPPSLQALVVQPAVVQSRPSIPPLPGGTGPLIPGLTPLTTSSTGAPMTVVASKSISPPSGRPTPITSPLGSSAVPPPKPPQPILPPQPTLLLGTSSPAAQLPVAAPLLPGLPMMPSQPGMTPMPPPSPVPPTSLVGLNSLAQNAGSSPPTQPTPPTPPIAVAAPAASQHPPMDRERLPSLESPLGCSALVEWAIPMASKLKYTQLFNTTDKKRSGFLTGPQARQILLASKLPQPILAQIWTLSDMDADGRLSCEEFVLALHLCDMARNGDTLPTSLPPQLVPPTLRRVRNNSLTSSEQGDPMAGINQVTFEDKRKENFEKGQAELDRRRKALLEIQRKEQEERERKEREELEKQERIRLEQEKKRQEEFERQLERQREIERAREEERRRAQEQREAARKEMERQRQLEWENQRLQELQTQRQKQQEQVLSLKAKSQALTIELTQKEDKVKELSKQISETRCGVTSVKSVIDGMRASRDTNLAEYNRLKTLVKQRNAQTLSLTQQKVKLEAAGGRLAGGGGGTEEQAREQAAFNDKTILIKNLKDKLKDLEDQVKNKETDVENNNAQLENLKKELTRILDECEELYTNYDEKRKKVFDLKGIPQPMNASDNAWSSSAWDSAPLTSPWPEEENVATPVGYEKYRALYEFIARNSDELSFQPGDIILVPTNQTAEPGWLSGELRGASGWFPESYVEPVDSIGTGLNGPLDVIPTAAPKTPLEGIVEVAESETGSVVEDSGPPLPTGPNPILGLGRAVSVQARALYSCTPSQGSQLAFLRGDIITISEIQEEWCYGQLNLSEGWLPKSYLSIEETQPSAPVKPITPEIIGGRGEYYVSLYPYTSEEGGDLTFDQGEVVLVTGKEGDWWTGQIGDRVGIFPSNYVQPHQEAVSAPGPSPPPAALLNNLPPHKTVEDRTPERVAPVPVFEEAPVEKKAVSPATADALMAAEGRVVTPDFSSLSSQVESGSGEESETKGGKARKPLIATVIAPYQATSKEQLNLQRGQLIMIRKKTSTGWWEGELQAKGKKRQIGWFPASYVKLLGGSGRTSQPLSRKTSETGIGDCLLERVVALYQYTAQNEDELSFDKGDLVTVLAKDEPTWWKGELNGMVGLFPSNYVAPQCENGPDLNQVNNNPVEKISREEKKRQQHIKELIATEQAYIDDMSIVHDVFEKPLIESRILTTDQVRTIFINWHEILECNYSFLRALRIRREMSKGGIIRQIGDILCENLPRMRVYVRFCGCQLRAATLLQSLTELNKDFQTLTKRCQSDPRTKGLPLSSFLIKPMQRITKYPLLINKILENTPDEHSDRQYLEEALAKAEELCSQVNEGVREKENSERLEWLQSHVLGDRLSEPLVFNSLTNAVGPRKFLHFGVVTKTKSGKELVGFLMNDILLLAQPNRPLGGLFNFDRHQNVLFRIYKQPLLLNELNILGHNNHSNSVEFKLEYNKTAFNLSAVSQNEKNLWLKKLIQAQTDLREHERDKLRRQQSIRMRRPKCSLKIIILAGRLLEPSTLRGVNREVFCEVSMGSQVCQTPAVPTPNGSDSKWNTSMQFLVKDLDEDVLCLTVKDKGNFSPDEFLGRTELRISEILADLRRADHGPIVKTLQLHEVRSGQVKLKLDVRLFNDNNN